MRKIGVAAIARFATLVTVEAGLALYVTKTLVMPSISEDFRGIIAVVSAILLFYMLAVVVFRLIQAVAPIPMGNIEAGSQAEQRAFLYMLHYLLFFNPLIFSRTLPFPLMRQLLRALGAKMGTNSYCAGIMMDPQFVTMGSNSIIGNSAMIIPHVIEGEKLGYYPVRIGNRVTIGARAIIMADVEIGDDAIIAVQSVVKKGSRVGKGETWGGSPARCLRLAE